MVVKVVLLEACRPISGKWYNIDHSKRSKSDSRKVIVGMIHGTTLVLQQIVITSLEPTNGHYAYVQNRHALSLLQRV